MAKFASKFNKGRKFDVDTTNFNYESMADMFNNDGAGVVYPLTAIYINTKSKYNAAPVFATDRCFVNAPSHMLDTAKEILADDEAVAAINNGEVGFYIYAYKQEKFNRDCFGINFVDIEKK
ncbi:MAG: hypothetical protein IJ295_01070 [Clostridia bacterium]|nr:hypothetical protein [Clostridia bacterium]